MDGKDENSKSPPQTTGIDIPSFYEETPKEEIAIPEFYQYNFDVKSLLNDGTNIVNMQNQDTNSAIPVPDFYAPSDEEYIINNRDAVVGACTNQMCGASCETTGQCDGGQNCLNICMVVDQTCVISCQETCQTNCMNTCMILDQTCVVSCETACESICQNACEVGTQTCINCLTVCQSTCQLNCQTVCEGTCQTCQTGCQVTSQACTTGCQVSCQSTCESVCQSTCQLGCQSTCELSCQNCQGLICQGVKFKVDNTKKTYHTGWVKVNGAKKQIASVWIKVNGVLKKL